MAATVSQRCDNIRLHLTKTLNDNHFCCCAMLETPNCMNAANPEVDGGAPWRCTLSSTLHCSGAMGNFVLVVAPALAQPDWTIWTPIAAAGAVAVWGFGRAACYLLSGH
jgi:hypothetical protein